MLALSGSSEDPKDKNPAVVPAWQGAGSDKPGCCCTRHCRQSGSQAVLLSLSPYPSLLLLLLIQEVRPGPRLSGFAWAGHAIWEEPHTRPRPFCRARPGASAGREGGLSPKSFVEFWSLTRYRPYCDTAYHLYFYLVMIFFFCCLSSVHYNRLVLVSPLALVPSLADFTARMKLTKVGVPMVCAWCAPTKRKEAARACRPTAPAQNISY